MKTPGERLDGAARDGGGTAFAVTEGERRERQFTVWTEDLAIGVEAIDQQHQRICEAVASLREGMKSNELWRVPGVLQALQRYADVHFITEEAEMARAGYPGLPVHRAAHLKFAAQLEAHQAALAGAMSPSAVLELSAWLAHWVRAHIRDLDGELGRFLRTRALPAGRARRGRPGSAG